MSKLTSMITVKRQMLRRSRLNASRSGYKTKLSNESILKKKNKNKVLKIAKQNIKKFLKYSTRTRNVQ